MPDELFQLCCINEQFPRVMVHFRSRVYVDGCEAGVEAAID